MKSFLQITLGIMTAAGGFIDIGDLVFATQSGAKYGYTLLWALLLGVIGIIIYSEMSGRVSAVLKRPVFVLIREETNEVVGLTALAASLLLNVLTCAAEVGGVAIVLQLLLGLPNVFLVLVAGALLAGVVWLLPFSIIEKVFGFGGLLLLIFLVAAIGGGPNWGQVGQGFIPQLDQAAPLTYLYFAVGIFAATMMPYEVYFYASGAIEEKWKAKDLPINRFTAIGGYVIGSLFVVGLIMLSAKLFVPFGVSPQFVSTSALGGAVRFGEIGLLIILLGMLFTIGGAAIETSLSGAYSLAQYRGWKWGKQESPRKTPHFTATWLAIFALAVVIMLFGVNPVQLTEYAVIFSVVLMPLTYLPILLVARNRKQMGKYANGLIMSAAAWIFFGLILIAAVSAVPLMLLTNQGKV